MINLKQKIKLEILITERDAMIAANDIRRYNGNAIAYDDCSFFTLAGKIEELLTEQKEEPLVIFGVDPAGNGSDRTGVILHQGKGCMQLEETEECCSECNWLNNEGKCDKKIESPDMYKCIAFENRDVIGTCESCKENIYDGKEYYHDTDGITWHKKCDCGREDE